MKLSEFKEKYKEEISKGEQKLINTINCIQESLKKNDPNIVIKLRIGNWSKINDKFDRWDSSLKIDVKNTNSDLAFHKAVDKISKFHMECFSKFMRGGDTLFDSFGLQYHKSQSFRNRQLNSKLYKEFIKWVGDKEPYPGDENSQLFLPRIDQIKGTKPDSESSGEKVVRIFLENNKIKYKQYHKIKGCFSQKNGKCYLLTFDFYIPSKNLVIEYDGGQHFAPVSKFGGQETFERTVMLDGIKNKFCQDNNIKMLRIPYTKKTKEVHEILKKELGIK